MVVWWFVPSPGGDGAILPYGRKEESGRSAALSLLVQRPAISVDKELG